MTYHKPHQKLLTPRKAIRAQCYDCSTYNWAEVAKCPMNDCELYLFRSGKGEAGQPKSVIKTIRKYCLWCCVGSSNEVKLCTCPKCPLFVYRFGHNPKLKGKGGKGNITALNNHRNSV